MQAGRLRHRVTIQRATTTTDALGDDVRAWSDVATVWARISPLLGREYIEAQAQQQATTHRVTIRYRSGVTSGDRVKFGTRTFHVRSVLNVEERGREVVLMCEEVT